jgi:hypothetical protein
MAANTGKRLQDYPEYWVWRGMNRRCHSLIDKDYKGYGSRGISVCARWREPKGQGFKNFLADLGPRPAKGYSLDRTNVNGNYEPANCRWVPFLVSQSNKRRRSSKFVGVTRNGGYRSKSWYVLSTGDEVFTAHLFDAIQRFLNQPALNFPLEARLSIHGQ